MNQFCNKLILSSAVFVGALAPYQALAAPVPTWSRTIGNVCMQGIPITARSIESAETNNGVVIEQFRVDFNATAPSSTTIVRVFRSPPEGTTPLTRCQDLKGDVLLEGRIKKLTIRGARETGAGVTPAFFEIGSNAGSFIDIELTKVKSTLAPLYGGQIELGKSGSIAPSELAWIRNAGPIQTSTGAPGIGAIDIETWGRNLKGARVQLPGSTEQVRTDLSAGNSNVTLRVRLDGTSTELRKGQLTSGPLRISGDVIGFPGASFNDFNGRSAALEVKASDSGVETKLSNLTYTASASNFGTSDTKGNAISTTGRIATIAGLGSRSGEAISFAEPTLLDHNVTGQACSYSHYNAILTEADACRFAIPTARAGLFEGLFETENPRTMIAPEAIFPAGTLQWKLRSSDGIDALTGAITNARVKLGALTVADTKLDFAQPAISSAELRFPFAISIGPANGSWSFSYEGNEATLKGRLQELLLRGDVSVPILAPSEWKISVAQNNFRFGGGISGEVKPHIYGGAPLYAAGTDLRFRATTDLEIAKSRRSGKVDTDIAIFALSNIDLELGERAANMVLKGPVSFSAGASLRYDIDRGSAELTRGKFDLANVLLHSKPGTHGDIGTVRVHDAKLKVGRIFADFDLAAGGGQVGLEDLTLAIGRVEQRPDVGADQTKWSGDLASPLSIGAVGATIRPNPKSGALELGDETIQQVKLDLAKPRFGQGRDLKFGGKSLSLDFPEISKSNIVGTLKLRDAGIYQNEADAEFMINGLDLTLNFLGGPIDKPFGNGRLSTGPVAANIDTDLKIEFEACDGTPRFRSLPVNVQFATTGVDLDLNMAGGKFKANGSTGVSGSVIKNTGSYECKKKLVAWRVVKEVRAKYKYPCPTWRKPFRMCKGWTTVIPEIRADVERSLRIRRLYAPGVFSSVTLDISHDEEGTTFKRCLKKGLFVPAMDVSYFITPKSNISIADSIIKEIIDLHSRPFMSTFTSSLVAGIGNSVMFTKNGWCV